jgi:tRNA modification GTPase
VYDDTIAALATSPGEAGLAIVRLSGPQSQALLAKTFRASRAAGRLDARRLVHGWVHDSRSGERVDEAMAVVMPGPHSFTGEDVAELHCHGGNMSPRRVLEAVLAAGARLAEPGEFSLRAFLNGRLDLAQAEAVLDVIQARTARAHQLALDGLAGRLSEKVRGVRKKLLEPQAYLEASIDFSEEDLPVQDVSPQLAGVLADIKELLAGADQGIVYRHGVRTAIVGRPNVGKSSLLNALLRSERAIVTELPGTTRDTVEETASLAGVPFWLVDTAGLRESEDPVEQLGVARSRAALDRADLVLLVLDASVLLSDEDHAVVQSLGDRPFVVALNKADLPAVLAPEALSRLFGERPRVLVSAVQGDGLVELEHELAAAALGGASATDPTVSNPRHKAALQRAEAAVKAALDAQAAGLPADIQAGEVAMAITALGEITGENATEDLLDTIFSRFCIGK